MTGAILFETRPAMIFCLFWRGEPRNTSAPKREISKREALIDIISIAQQASPKAIGQMEFFRPQLITLSSVVGTTPDCNSCCSMVSLSMRENRSAGPLASSVLIAPLCHSPEPAADTLGQCLKLCGVSFYGTTSVASGSTTSSAASS